MNSKFIKLILLIFTFSIFSCQFSKAQIFWNQACSFAGASNKYIAVPNSASLNITGNFTLEAWINPSTVSPTAKTIISKGSSMKYAIQMENGRIKFYTNGVLRLATRATVPIPTGQWTHIAALYDTFQNEFRFFVNGFPDTVVFMIGSFAPTPTTDSLFIGSGGFGTHFPGEIDEVRIWNKAISFNELKRNMFSSLGISGGFYNGLVMSLTFQDDEASGPLFSLTDMSSNNNNGFNRGGVPVDLSNRPSATFTQNESVELDGDDDYLSCGDTTTINPANQITLECWVYTKSLTICKYISKGTTSAAGTKYALFMGLGISAVINGTTIIGAGLPTVNKWSHIAFTYSASDGAYKFYVDGILTASGINNLGNITSGASDSLYIGGDQVNAGLIGFIDEVRISNYVKSQNEIVRYLYESIDLSNNPSIQTRRHINYSLDGNTFDNGGDGGPKLKIRGDAKFSAPAFVRGNPVSPINRADLANYSNGFYMKKANFLIPNLIADTLFVNLDEQISDVNLYVAINHADASDIEITLKAPNNEQVIVFNRNVIKETNQNIITMFDDQADSSVINSHYISISNFIKPLQSLNSTFAGDNSKGAWKLILRDLQAFDSGFCYSWGININNKVARERNLNLSAIMQGFYNSSTNLMLSDTMKVILRNSTSPFNVVDTSSAFLSNTGDGLFSLDGTKVFDGVQYYIQLKHRNSIETWSKTTQAFSFSSLSYDFRTSNNKAFGDNQIQVDNSPVRFAIYSGDVNQDGSVDVIDVGSVYNDANNSVSGYVNTDLNGDEFVDVFDVGIVYNNSQNSVSAITPL